jgi:hypothetical protein
LDSQITEENTTPTTHTQNYSGILHKSLKKTQHQQHTHKITAWDTTQITEENTTPTNTKLLPWIHKSLKKTQHPTYTNLLPWKQNSLAKQT